MPWPCWSCWCLKKEVETVRMLDYNHHSLKEVPADVFSHERTLETLLLEANRISELPRALFHCHGLRELNLSDNDIKIMPPAIASLINLQHLNLSKNSLSDIPDNIKCCKLLTYVNVSVNPLEKLPEGFTQLIALEELYLNDTFLEYLPANFGRLAKLRILDLRDNNLNTLPKSIARLANLKVLDIGRNEFSDLPEVIGNLPELTELWADSNKIRGVPPFIGNLENLTSLDISNNNIQWIAPEIKLCQRLSFLVASSNELQNVPEEIGELKNLEILKVDDNDLEVLPASIGKLANLQELVISQNVIDALPPTIGLLRKMEILNADDNRLCELPSELCSCSCLRILSVRSNMLDCMPAEIGHLSGVRVINIANNLLRNLPVSILNLAHLTALWLSTNQATPLTTLQQDIDPNTGQVVCVNFMFPQVEQDRGITLRGADDSDSEPVDVERSNRPHIRFADTADARHPSRLTRAPTPYPKELRSMAKHARILVTRPAHHQFPVPDEGGSEEGEPLLGGEAQAQGLDPRAVTIKTAKVKRNGIEADTLDTIIVIKSPVMMRDDESLYDESEYPSEPTHPPIISDDIYMAHETDPRGRVAPSGSGSYLLTQDNSNIANSCAGSFYDDTSFDIQPIIYANKFNLDGSFKENIAPAEAPYYVSPERVPADALYYDSPERGPMSDPGGRDSFKEAMQDPMEMSSPINDGPDLRLHVTQSLPVLLESHAGAKVPPPYHIAAIHSKQAAFFQHSPKGVVPVQGSPSESRVGTPNVYYSGSPMWEISQAPLSPPIELKATPPELNLAARMALEPENEPDGGQVVEPADLSRIQEETVDGEMSTSSVAILLPPPSPEQPEASNGHLGETRSSVTPDAQCRIPVPKESASRSIPKPQALSKLRSPPAQHPGKPVSKIPSFKDSKSPTRPANGVSGTRIRQPGFRSSSQPPATPQPATIPPTGNNDGDVNNKTWPDDNNKTSSDDGLNIPDMNNANVDGYSNGEASAKASTAGAEQTTPSGFKSRIPSLSPGKNSPLWVFGQHKNPRVFPVMLVKNPGLGFSIGGGSGPPSENPGIFISKVHAGGPASTFLQPGDKILEVDGIDFLKLEHDQAVGILKQTKNVVNMMISRQK